MIWLSIPFYSKSQFTFWSDCQSLFLWFWSEKDQNFPIIFCYGNRYFFCIFLKESLKKSSRKIKTSIHKLKNLFNIRKKILCFILEEMLNGILCLFFYSRKSWTSTSCRRNNKKIGKKSDRVIGNRDLIANPFFQGYFRSDLDRILDHFLAKGSGFDCQSQKKWSVTTMRNLNGNWKMSNIFQGWSSSIAEISSHMLIVGYRL